MDITVGSGQNTTLAGLVTAAPEEFERQLATLLAAVEPIVSDAVRRTLRGHFHADAAIADDVDDVRSEAVVLLVRKLRDVREAASPEPIENFGAYAATVAENACYTYLRRRYPEWTRLKNQVRYVMRHDAELSLRPLPSGESVCVSNARGPVPLDTRALSLRDSIKAIVTRSARPMELNDVVRAVADARGIQRRSLTAASLDLSESAAERTADSSASTDDHISFLREVWRQVRELPLRQRIALLLNLRDEGGAGVLPLFPLTAVASMRQIAGVLEMPSEELARVWTELPLDDRRIAERLGVTRQQVINLRKSARARLARRVRIRW